MDVFLIPGAKASGVLQVRVNIRSCGSLSGLSGEICGCVISELLHDFGLTLGTCNGRWCYTQAKNSRTVKLNEKLHCLWCLFISLFDFHSDFLCRSLSIDTEDEMETYHR